MIAFARYLISVLLLISLPASVAWGQGRVKLKDVDQRLQRVERVVDQSLLELLQQVESLKREIRTLRGELENQANELDVLRKRNRDLYLDTDQRITDIEDRTKSGDLLEPNDNAEPLILPNDDEAQPDSSTTGDAGKDPPLTSTVAAVAGLSETNSAQEVPAVTVSTRPAPSATLKEKQAYTKAYDMLASGDHAKTVLEFQRFLKQFPVGPYADNAWYWQGEALYAQRLFDKAIKNFQVVIDSFPDSPKLADAQLKVGFSLYEMQRFIDARNILNSVKNDFPGRSAAVLARKRLEQMEAKGL